MGGHVVYVVKSGDWLAKIAEEHGTTVSAIWNDPLNAEHRAKRKSPDVLYPGDVLHILSLAPNQPPPELPVPPEPPPPEPPTPPPTLLPWPYPPAKPAPPSVPTWTCPDTACSCHPVEGDSDKVSHRLVLRDGQGRRMPHARCIVYDNGRAITTDPTAADGLGELNLELSENTTSLWIEWAPAETPLEPSLPYGKRYLIVSEEDDAQDATRRRLTNLGFGHWGRLTDCVHAYQVATGLEPTGATQDIHESLRQHHDEGSLHGFASLPGKPAGFTEASGLHSLFGAPPTIGTAWSLLGGVLAAPGGGGGGGGLGGTVVAPTTHVLMLVGLDGLDGPLDPTKVTARLRPNNPLPGGPTLIKPSFQPMSWNATTPQLVLVGFKDVPAGDYTGLVHVKGGSEPRGYALGSFPFKTVPGISMFTGVHAHSIRPILTVHDPLLDLDVPPMQRRRKVLATLHRNFPRSANFQAKSQGIQSAFDQGEFQPMLERPTTGNSCTSVNGAMMNAAAGPGMYAYNISKSPGFFPYKSGRVPSVGDSFVLMAFNNPDDKHHTGIVVQTSTAMNSLWLTADGGQRDQMSQPKVVTDASGKKDVERKPLSASREAAFIVPRIFGEHDHPGHGQLGNLHWFPASKHAFGWFIEGWLDITHPHVPFSTSGYSALGTEQDYKDMKKRVARVEQLVALDRIAAKAMI